MLRVFCNFAANMKKLVFFLLAVTLLSGCGQSYEEAKRERHQTRVRLAKEDSAALKIAVLPTLDCLPLYVAQELGLYDTTLVDVRLKPFTAQMDCDTALMGTTAEGAVTDLVRMERLVKQGARMHYVAQTGAYWQLFTNQNARIHQLKHLEDKMVAMTRYSVTDMLTDKAVDSAKVKSEFVFRIQVNDIDVRMQMLENNVMDALWLPEPQATEARLAHHPVLLDSRRLGMNYGVLAFNQKKMRSYDRRVQLDAFVKGYDAACDTINKLGIGHFRDLAARYCKVDASVIDSLPKNITFLHARGPLQQDIEKVNAWLKK